MSIPEYLQLPEPVVSQDDAIENDGYFPDLSIAEFEQNYQVTDVFQGKTRYLLNAAMVSINSQLDKTVGITMLPSELESTYRMCVYAYAMMLICQRYGSVDTQTKSEFVQEIKAGLAQVYRNELRRLLLVLSGSYSEVT